MNAHLSKAIANFEDNIRNQGITAQSKPVDYNLNTGLLNLSKALADIQSEVTILRQEIQQLKNQK